MSSPSTLIFLNSSGSGIDVVCNIQHTSDGMSDTDNPHVSQVTFFHNNVELTRFDLGPDFARNPMVGVHLPNLIQGDQLQVNWIDTAGNQGSGSATYLG